MMRYKHTTPIKTACKQVANELADELSTRTLTREQTSTILFSVIRSSVEDTKRRIKRDSRANTLVPLILYRAGFPRLVEWTPECSMEHFKSSVNAIRQYWAKLRRTVLRPFCPFGVSQTGGAGATDWIQDCRTLDLSSLTVGKCIDLMMEYYHSDSHVEEPPSFADISTVAEESLDSIALSAIVTKTEEEEEPLSLPEPLTNDSLSLDEEIISPEKRKRARTDLPADLEDIKSART